MEEAQRFPKLFQPGRIGKLEIGNRIIMAPMETRLAEPDGRYSQRLIDYFVARAKGGVGLILTGLTMVESEISPYHDLLTTYLDAPYQIPGTSDLVEAVHDYGVKIGVQFSAGLGRNIHGASPEKVPVSASAVPAFTDPRILCRELSVEEIKKIILAFGDAAERAVTAGFDMIELHAHAGYLIDQFMTPLWNKRKDEYGGDIEGRMKFAVEIINAIRARVGADFPLSFRYAAEHRIKGGRTLSESKEIAQRLEAVGIDILHIDAGCYESQHWIAPPIYLPEGCFVDLAAAMKQVVNIPVITVGGITSPELAEKILDEGSADFICLGRALLADPDWPNKAREGRVQDIRPCIRCLDGCLGRMFAFKTISCSVNPVLFAYIVFAG